MAIGQGAFIAQFDFERACVGYFLGCFKSDCLAIAILHLREAPCRKFLCSIMVCFFQVYHYMDADFSQFFQCCRIGHLLKFRWNFISVNFDAGRAGQGMGGTMPGIIYPGYFFV